ncbi:vicilin Cor a 11.0101-like [Typha latifolia]|uniref:vicilin Cor a 11.0101-like n=1 Tax=Typha latifolia TaxID=4733 RepID=UPI003C2AB7F6
MASLLLIILSLTYLIPSLASDIETRCSKICHNLQEDHIKEQCKTTCLSWYNNNNNNHHQEASEKDVNKEKKGEEKHNPYYFGEERYEHWTRTQHGHFKVLERFSKRSKLLAGIENYRLAILKAEPNTFIMPSHWDVDEVFYVTRGQGTITLLWEGNKESYDIKEGDIMTIPSGVIVYLINKDSNEKLRIAMLLQPVSLPGRFEEFFGVGGKNPETFYTTFSNEVLQAAFNTPLDRLKRLFGKQEKGVIIRASEEQITALSKSSTEGGGGPRTPFNVLSKQPSHANNYGQLYEANVNDYQFLRELDVDISIANISQGSMMAPNYNSRSTKIALVVQGSGYFEMACPHISKELEESYERKYKEHGQSYHLVRSQVRRGSVFVIPASHPVAAVASKNENLLVLCFGTRAENNDKFFLAGKNNVLNQMEREAKELAFDWPAEEVDEVLNAQPESVFFPAPEGRGSFMA